jgi:hypothetical protein
VEIPTILREIIEGNDDWAGQGYGRSKGIPVIRVNIDYTFGSTILCEPVLDNFDLMRVINN